MEKINFGGKEMRRMAVGRGIIVHFQSFSCRLFYFWLKGVCQGDWMMPYVCSDHFLALPLIPVSCLLFRNLRGAS